MLVSNPELVTNQPVPSDPFEAVERRIWWGLIIGVGLVPFFHNELRPWLPTVLAIVSSLLVGILVARLIGILLDGSVLKQWLYVGIENVMIAPLVWWYLNVRA